MRTDATHLAGERIRVAREAKEWGLRDLAREADLDYGFVGKIERGAPASVPVYERLADALGVPLAALFEASARKSVTPRSRRKAPRGRRAA